MRFTLLLAIVLLIGASNVSAEEPGERVEQFQPTYATLTHTVRVWGVSTDGALVQTPVVEVRDVRGSDPPVVQPTPEPEPASEPAASAAPAPSSAPSSIEELVAQYPWPLWQALAVMQCESEGNPNVVSPVGAVGLFQIHPYSAANFDPATNIAAAYQKYLYGVSIGNPWYDWNQYGSCGWF